MYADDVVIFANPDAADLGTIRLLLNNFGESSGLFTNFAKSSMIPIQCQQIDMEALSLAFQCPLQEFPCTYLSMPLSDRRLRKADLQPALDKLAGRVKG